jgi:methylenetetrahydrofolate dehydrogenase (NADP+)/methenyltetrahydrofolate cyclohydrolase
MAARIIDGKAVAARVRAQVAEDVAAFAAEHGRPPGLATILVGDDEASAVYVGGKQKASAEVGIEGFSHKLPGDARKDVDGLTPMSAGLLALGRDGLRPCTPLGVMLLLEEAGVALEGAEAVVVGRSNLFGKPMAQLLLAANATVTTCHSRTHDLGEVCRRADVLIAAAGRPRMIQGDWVKPGATVIDVGINRTADGLVGDVDFEPAGEAASAITPVPGGVGPMTIACLLRNTLQAARMQAAG